MSVELGAEAQKWLEKIDEQLQRLALNRDIDLSAANKESSGSGAGNWGMLPLDAVRQRLLELCPRIKSYVEDPAHVSQPEWFYLAGTLKSLLDDSELFHLWSTGHPQYTADETQRVWDRSVNAPARCSTYQQQAPMPECASCPYYSKNESPNLILRREFAKQLGVKGPYGAPEGDQPHLTKATNVNNAAAIETIDDSEPFDFGIEESDSVEEGEIAGEANDNIEMVVNSSPVLVVDNIQSLVDLLDPIIKKIGEAEDTHIVSIFDEAKETLSKLRKMSPVKANAILKIFHNRGLNVSDMRAELDIVDAELERIAASAVVRVDQPHGEAEVLPRVKDMLPDCPLPGLLVPEKYTLTKKGTFRAGTTKDGEVIDIKIASAPVIIQEIYVDIDQDIEYIKLAWLHRKKWKSIIVERDYIANAHKMVDLSVNGFPADSLNTKGVVKYLLTLESLNQSIIPAVNVTTHVGWQAEQPPNCAFLLGKSLLKSDPKYEVQYRGASLADERLVDGYHTEGSIDAWLQALAPAMQHPKVALAFYSSFVSPLLEIFGCPNFIVEYAGRTSVGKTTALRVAASVWGNPDERMPDTTLHTWDATRVWIERSCSILSGLPMILDDTKRAKNPETVSEIAYTLTSGHGRGRGKPQGIAHEDSWRNVTISSGETPITSFTEDGGIKGRVLEIIGMPFAQDNEESRIVVNNLNQTIVHNYGHGAEIFINWLIKYRAEYGDIWRSLYQDYAKVYESKTTDGVAARLATYVGAIWATADLVAMAFEEAGHLLPWVVSDPVAPLWDDIALQAQDPVGEVEALRDVESWCSANEQSFLGREIDKKQPSGGWIGRWDRGEWEFIAIRREPLFQFLERAGYNPEEIMTAWKGRKWIDTFEHQKGFQKRIWIKGENKSDWFVVLKREIFNTVNK